MQRRLTLAMFGIALAAIVLVGAGVLVLAQFGARQDARERVDDQLEALSDVVAGGQALDRLDQTLGRLGTAFDVGRVELIVVDSDGVVWLVDRRRKSGTNVRLDADALATFDSGQTVLLDTDGAVVGIEQVELPLREQGPQPKDSIGLLVQQDVATIGRQARLWFLVSAAAVLVGSVLVATWLASRFIRPLKEIELATARIAAGDLDARVTVDGDDELAQLGDAVNRMAGDLDRSRASEQEFLMSVSHDLRTPLTAISGYAEALSDGAVDDTTHTGDIIASNARRLNRLVDDLLDLARLSANRFRFELRPLDASQLVEGTVAGHQPAAADHGLRLTTDLAESAMVVADADRLEQAVGNLIDNAVKFARSEIGVAVRPVDDAVVISVADDGPGIPAADLPFVFERLYVTKLQPRRAENSSGLGLAIVRELTQAMGGSVTAASATDGGTTMTLTLPRSGSSDRSEGQ